MNAEVRFDHRVLSLASLLPLALLCSFGLLTSACDAQEEPEPGICDGETRGDPYIEGLSKTCELETCSVALSAVAPTTPDLGSNDWEIVVSGPEGKPSGECSVVLVPWMPEHGHGSNEPQGVAGANPGVFSLSDLRITMPGYWEFTLEVTCPDQPLDQAEFGFCIEG